MESNNERFGKGRFFERIRRITGYLVGTLDKWNNAKKAEEKDRVKHNMQFTGTNVFFDPMSEDEDGDDK